MAGTGRTGQPLLGASNEFPYNKGFAVWRDAANQEFTFHDAAIAITASFLTATQDPAVPGDLADDCRSGLRAAALDCDCR